MINITLPDGSVRQYESGTTAMQIAESISMGLAQNVLSAIVNGEIREAIMDKGVVNVSMSTDKVKWIPMPYANSVIGFYLWYDIGSLTVTSVNLTTNPFDTQYLYKYIKISTIDGN